MDNIGSSTGLTQGKAFYNHNPAQTPYRDLSKAGQWNSPAGEVSFRGGIPGFHTYGEVCKRYKLLLDANTIINPNDILISKAKMKMIILN